MAAYHPQATARCWTQRAARWQTLKGSGLVDSNVLLHQSSDRRILVAQVFPGQLWGLEGGGGRRSGHPSLLCPLLAPAHDSGSGGWWWWVQSTVLPFWMINRDQNVVHSYYFSCWARIASAAVTSFLRKVRNGCGSRPPERHLMWLALDVHCAELMVPRAPRAF